ncbi:MAG TPA: MFS transporter, partial [Nakamurella sp.]|nr:MFS transporter [Nakamurella sp.]
MRDGGLTTAGSGPGDDYAIYSGSATVLAAALAPGGWAGIITIFAVFATSCLLRPLGSLVAGARADRLGRRRTLATMILMMAAATVAIGLAIGLGTTAAVAALVDTATLHSWAWRVPFLLAIPLGLVGLYFRTSGAETPDFHHDPGRDSRADSGPTPFPRYSAAFNIWFVFVPRYVTTTGHNSLAVSLACAMVGLVSTAIAAPFFGRLSDRIGRRPVLVGGCSVLVVAGIPVYLWAVSGSAAALLVGNVIVGVTVAAFVLPSYLAEQ